MNIDEITNAVNKAEKKINEIKQMLEDYQNCKSETSRKMIELGLNKLASFLDDKTTSK